MYPKKRALGHSIEGLILELEHAPTSLLCLLYHHCTPLVTKYEISIPDDVDL